MEPVAEKKEGVDFWLVPWVFIYQCLTSKQKDELLHSIELDRPPDYTNHPCFILAEDKDAYLHHYNIVLALRLHILRKHFNFVWSNRDNTIKLKVIIRDKDVLDDDVFVTNKRLEALRGLSFYCKTKLAYVKTVTIQSGEINRCLSEATTSRREVYEALGMDIPDSDPICFTSPDVADRWEIHSEVDSLLTLIFGKNKDLLINAGLQDEVLDSDNNDDIPHIAGIEDDQGNGLCEQERWDHAGWDMQRIQNAIHTDIIPSQLNNRFQKSFENLRVRKADVLIVGAGISGLAAANYLSACGVDVVVIEGRHRIGGRAYTSKFPQRELDNVKLPEVSIDLGANYLHCCNSVGPNTKAPVKEYLKDPRSRRNDFRSIIGMCQKLRPTVADVAGGANWESTVYARWGDMEGKQININSVVKANMIAEKIRVRAARKVSNLKKFMRNVPGNTNITNHARHRWYVREGLYRELFNNKTAAATLTHAEVYDYSSSNHHAIHKRSCLTSAVDEDSSDPQESHHYGKKATDRVTNGITMKKRVVPADFSSQDSEGGIESLETRNKSRAVQNHNGFSRSRHDSQTDSKYHNGLSLQDCSRMETEAASDGAQARKTLNKYKRMERMLKNSPTGIPRHIKASKTAKSKSYLFDDEGNRKSLWDIYIEAIVEIFQENKLSMANVTEVEWDMIFVILQSRTGYNSDLRETCISMCRLPNVDEEFDDTNTYLSKDSYSSNIKFVLKHFKEQNRVKQKPFRCNNDSDKLIIDGWDWLLNCLSDGLENYVYLNSRVSDINVTPGDKEYPVSINIQPSQDPGTYSKAIMAKYVIVTVPSSMLSPYPDKRQYDNQILFKPPLDSHKRAALTRYKMGSHNKVILRFHPNDIFWSSETPQLNTLDPRFQFLNLDMYGKTGCILAHCFPPFSSTFAEIDSDAEIVRRCLDALRTTFGIDMNEMPYPVDALVTRWYKDSFAMGSYSYPGLNASDEDIIHLKSPHPLEFPRILFAGEYLSSSYYQCVDGAYDTGMRAAEDVAHLGLERPYPFPVSYSTPSLDGMLCPTSREKYLGLAIPLPGQDVLGFYLTDGSDEALTDDNEDNVWEAPIHYKEELPLLTTVKQLLGVEVVEMHSYSEEIFSVLNFMDNMRIRNAWNNCLGTAYKILKSVLDVVECFKGNRKTRYLDMGSNMVSKLVLQYFLANEGIRHDYVCHACHSGGELLMCDTPTCTKVWHAECLPFECSNATMDSSSWTCPACQHAYSEGNEEVESLAVSLYWTRRTDWWSVKTLITQCRKVANRIQFLMANKLQS